MKNKQDITINVEKSDTLSTAGEAKRNLRLLMLILLLLPCTISAQAQFFVSGEAALRAIAGNLSGHYILTEDLTLSQEWTPLGDKDHPFTGILDGGGHVIHNLRINDDNRPAVGLFACTDGAQIINLGITDVEVTTSRNDATTCAGALIGEATATTVTATGISGGEITGKGWVGSLIGRTLAGAAASTIKNCYSTAAVTSSSSSSGAGGMVGQSRLTEMENCYYAGVLQAPYAVAGGIIASAEEDNSVLSCVVVSPTLQGKTAKRMVGEKTGTLTVSLNWARADMQIGYRSLSALPANQAGFLTLQGANMAYDAPEFTSGLPAYTEADITAAYEAFNKRFYITTGKRIYYEGGGSGSKVAAVWVQAIYFDMAQNAFKRSGDVRSDSARILNLFAGNKAEYADFDWTVDRYPNGWFIYDDIMWWVVALARAYEVTGNEQYLALSQTGFERVWSGAPDYDNGSYDDPARGGSGGMFWAWDRDNPVGSPNATMGKMACINYPTVIGAMTLFNNTGDSLYRSRAIEIYEWARNNLFDRTNTDLSLLGRVADSKHGSGNPAWKMHVYNQATCIGAAVMLYKETGERRYLEDAVMAADYTKNTMSVNGFLHFETGVEQGIYHAIFAQYIARLIYDCGQYQYLSWLRYNIDSGWANRLVSTGTSNNVCYKDYANPAPAISNIQSYDASGIPALMLLIPPTTGKADEVHCKNRYFYEKTLGWDFENTWKWNDNDSLPCLIFQTPSLGIGKIPAADSSVKVYSRDRKIYVNAAQPVTVEVYDTLGRIQGKSRAEEAGIALPSGLYLVRTWINNRFDCRKIIHRW
jgi:predicted alpha-1,6-mannanase (GH76 family)